MKTIILNITLIMSLSLISTACYAFETGVRGNYWFTEPNGNTRVDTPSLDGTDFDLKNDLGIPNKNFLTYQFFLSGNKHNLALSYGDLDYSAHNRITRNIIFNGQTYNIGDVLDSSVKFSMFDLFYQYDFINIDNMMTKFSLGSVFQVKYLDGLVKISTTGSDENSDFSIPAPMIGLNLSMGMMADMVEANVRGTGISYSRDNLYEIMGEISWSPLPFVGVYGGYKAFAINVDEDDINLDFNISGPYIGFELSL